MATRKPCGASKIAETCTYQSRHLVPRCLVTSRGSYWRLRDYEKVAFENPPRDRRWRSSWRVRVTWNVGTISSFETIFRAQNGCQTGGSGGGKGDQGKQRWKGAGRVLTKRAASAIQQAGKNDGRKPQVPFPNVGHRRRRRG
jgi:hypothetical protein